MELFASAAGWTEPSVLLLGAVYVSPWKLLGLLALGVAWAKYAEWADKDAQAVNTLRQLWNLGTLGVGLAIFACAVLVPNFWIGHGIAWVVFLGFAGAYVLHRNGLVESEFTLLTADHMKRIREQGLFGKKEKKEREVVERVQLRGPKGVLRVPEDEETRETYADTQDLLYEILLRRASRVELAPSGEIAKVAYEVDGQAVERDPLDRVSGDGIVNYVKQSLGLNIEEKRKPQTGKLTAKVADSEFELRVRTDGSVAGEKLTIRVIGPEKKWRVADIGFTDKQMVEIQNLLTGDPGVIVVSGPKRNGLTTTVYSFTRSHDAFLQNIQLIEYTNELEIDNVTQKQFQPAETTTFTDELMRIIRSDPDILIVPELREPPAAAAMAKAGQKTKIYTTVTANDAVEAIRRWMQLVAEPDLASKGLRAVLNQRLVRKLCKQCREAYKPDAGLLKKLNLPADAVLYRVPQQEYDKNGQPLLCPACQGVGYVGRTGVFELVLVDETLRDAMRKGGAQADLQAIVNRGAHANLQRQGLAKVLDGTTSIQELVRVLKGDAPAPAAKGTAA